MPSTARAFDASAEPAWHDGASAALTEIEALQLEATAAVRKEVSADGQLSASLIEREQHAAHGLAWFATYVQAIREMLAYHERLSAEGRFGETEELLTRDRNRRIPRADFRRNPDEPRRDRSPERFRTRH